MRLWVWILIIVVLVVAIFLTVRWYMKKEKAKIEEAITEDVIIIDEGAETPTIIPLNEGSMEFSTDQVLPAGQDNTGVFAEETAAEINWG